MKDSLWRQPYLIELTYAENFRLVKEAIHGKSLKILEIGCGTGFMSLELARMGHYVTAIDRNRELVGFAERTRKTDPYRKDRGNLSFEAADFNKWKGEQGTYDLVLFSRVLHDMPRPDEALSRAQGQLKSRGNIVCLEYAYDMMDRKAATWLYQIRRLLGVVGWTGVSRLPENPEAGVDTILKDNSQRKEHINTFEEMRQPLKQLFHKVSLSWHCYYFWDIIREARIPYERREKDIATLLRNMEQFLMETREIRPVLFRFVGRAK